MGEYVDNIRRIANKKQNKAGLSTAAKRSGLPGNTKLLSDLNAAEENSSSLKPPLTFKLLTYDPADNIPLTDSTGSAVTDDNNNEVIIIKGKTAVVIDANGRELTIDNIDLDNAVPI